MPSPESRALPVHRPDRAGGQRFAVDRPARAKRHDQGAIAQPGGAGAPFEREGGPGRRRPGAGVRHRHRLVEMELARAAVIVEPVGEVDILLDLDQRDAAADGVDRAGGRIEEVALRRRPPIEQAFDAAVERGLAERRPGNFAGQAEPDHGVRLGVDHVPGFVLAAGIASGAGGRVVRVDLDRQPLGGEQIFDEQRGIVRRLEPDLADRLVARRAGKARRQVPPAPDPLDGPCAKTMGGHGLFALIAPAVADKARGLRLTRARFLTTSDSGGAQPCPFGPFIWSPRRGPIS